MLAWALLGPLALVSGVAALLSGQAAWIVVALSLETGDHSVAAWVIRAGIAFVPVLLALVSVGAIRLLVSLRANLFAVAWTALVCDVALLAAMTTMLAPPPRYEMPAAFRVPPDRSAGADRAPPIDPPSDI
jgi:hypothetical protein